MTTVTDSIELAISGASLYSVRGHVVEVSGTLIRAVVPDVRIGELCLMPDLAAKRVLKAEVVGFSNEKAVLSPLGRIEGIKPGIEVIPTGHFHTIGVGPALRGRVLDGLGDPLDSDTNGPLITEKRVSVINDPPHPLKREMISRPLATGVRAIDGFLTMGEGQRTGVFAAAGVGKSTLMAKMARSTDADAVVIALIGERGREVREFIVNSLGTEGMARASVVVATSDRPAMEKIRAAYVATTIAEYYRDMGMRVMLIMDSVTRFARALREIGLAAGEPPTRRGFPPSVFSALPLLMERAGPGEKGSITGIYTVLVEGDDMNEPVADEMRSLLDGHIVLSRDLAAAGQYPAIDVLASVSRLMESVAGPEHRSAARRLRALMARYSEIEMLVQIGEYKRGSDRTADEAVDKINAIRSFLRQGMDETSSLAETSKALTALV
jgi:type III secretion protein N (ATPase)